MMGEHTSWVDKKHVCYAMAWQVHVLAPFGWNILYDASVRAQAAGRIYLYMAVVHVSRLAITATMSDPPVDKP